MNMKDQPWSSEGGVRSFAPATGPRPGGAQRPTRRPAPPRRRRASLAAVLVRSACAPATRISQPRGLSRRAGPRAQPGGRGQQALSLGTGVPTRAAGESPRSGAPRPPGAPGRASQQTRARQASCSRGRPVGHDPPSTQIRVRGRLEQPGGPRWGWADRHPAGGPGGGGGPAPAISMARAGVSHVHQPVPGPAVPWTRGKRAVR